MSHYHKLSDNLLFELLNRSISATDKKAIKAELRSRGYTLHRPRYDFGLG